MTPETFKIFARYNEHVNSEMNRYISVLSSEEWTKNCGGYYKSVKALCSHLYITDFAWLKRFGLLRPFKYSNDPIFSNVISPDSIPFDTIKEYIEKRHELDLFIQSFVEEINPEDSGKELHYKNWKNEDRCDRLAGWSFTFSIIKHIIGG